MKVVVYYNYPVPVTFLFNTFHLGRVLDEAHTTATCLRVQKLKVLQQLLKITTFIWESYWHTSKCIVPARNSLGSSLNQLTKAIYMWPLAVQRHEGHMMIHPSCMHLYDTWKVLNSAGHMQTCTVVLHDNAGSEFTWCLFSGMQFLKHLTVMVCPYYIITWIEVHKEGCLEAPWSSLDGFATQYAIFKLGYLSSWPYCFVQVSPTVFNPPAMEGI